MCLYASEYKEPVSLPNDAYCLKDSERESASPKCPTA